VIDTIVFWTEVIFSVAASLI